jgi:outer membrane immunogenic protein
MGPYLGVNAGYQWGQISNDPTRPSGILGGIQAGFNWRTGDRVYGSEIDAQITGADAVFAPWKFANPWFGTARGRVGYAFQNVLLYGTGGVAIGGVRAESMLLTELHTAFGWTAGLGAEFKFAQNWSAKAEYLYINLANRPFSITGVTNGYKFNVLRVGVNYHF